MAAIDVNVVFEALGVRADAGAAPPESGMSGSAVVGARTGRGDPVVVKVTRLATEAGETSPALRELHVYTDLSQRLPIPSPRLVAAHDTDTWIAIAIERHEPTPPASAWTTDQWLDLATLLGRMHRRTRGINDVLPLPEPAKPRSHEDLLLFAQRLWNGPGDAARLKVLLHHSGRLRDAAGIGPRSFVHGDSHLGNAVRTAEGQLLMVDWQSAHIGSSAGDIAFAFTRAADIVTTMLRDQVIDAYSEAADVDPGSTCRAVTAHQLLTLVEQYPEFADFLSPDDVDALRQAFDALLSEWRDHG